MSKINLLLAELRDGFRTLQRIQYAAPWRSQRREPC